MEIFRFIWQTEEGKDGDGFEQFGTRKVKEKRITSLSSAPWGGGL